MDVLLKRCGDTVQHLQRKQEVETQTNVTLMSVGHVSPVVTSDDEKYIVSNETMNVEDVAIWFEQDVPKNKQTNKLE